MSASRNMGTSARIPSPKDVNAMPNNERRRMRNILLNNNVLLPDPDARSSALKLRYQLWYEGLLSYAQDKNVDKQANKDYHTYHIDKLQKACRRKDKSDQGDEWDLAFRLHCAELEIVQESITNVNTAPAAEGSRLPKDVKYPSLPRQKDTVQASKAKATRKKDPALQQNTTSPHQRKPDLPNNGPRFENNLFRLMQGLLRTLWGILEYMFRHPRIGVAVCILIGLLIKGPSVLAWLQEFGQWLQETGNWLGEIAMCLLAWDFWSTVNWARVRLCETICPPGSCVYVPARH